MTRLNATAASLLGFLHDVPQTGWELVALAQERIGAFWTLTQSQVYRELTAMAAAGLVEAGSPGPRDRKPYSITNDGREAFAQWLAGEPGADQIRIPLLLTLAFSDHLPAGRLTEIVLLAAAIAVDAAGRDAASWAVSVALLGLGVVMIARSWADAPGTVRLVHGVGFGVIGLFDAFWVVTLLRGGFAWWIVAAAGVGIAVVGHVLLGRLAARKAVITVG